MELRVGTEDEGVRLDAFLAGPLDLSPIIAIFVLNIARSIVVRLIQG